MEELGAGVDAPGLLERVERCHRRRFAGGPSSCAHSQTGRPSGESEIAYEALAWGRHVSEYYHAWRIVREADHPALGVCLDSFHILSRGTSLDAIGETPVEKLFFLQLADAPHLVMDVLQWSRHYRCFPGQGGFDLAGFTSRVLDAGSRRPPLARGF